MEEKYIEMITEAAQRSKSNTHQIEEIKEDIKSIKEDNKALSEIATSVKLIAQDMTHVKEDVSEVKNSQSEMKRELSEVKNERTQEKVKTFDNIKGMVFTAIATGIIAFVLGTIAPAIFK